MDEKPGELVPSSLTPAEFVEAVAKGSTGAFLETIGAGVVETGHWLGDRMRFRRFQSQVKMAVRAKAMLDEAGLSPHVVPSKILFPLLQTVIFDEDDDDDVQRRWAALLANAAAGDVTPDVMPSYPRILAELVPVEAKMLEWLAGLPAGTSLGAFMEQAGLDQTVSGPLDSYAAHVDNLERLQLVYVTFPHSSPFGGGDTVDERRPAKETPAPRAVVHMSSLGLAFVAACTPPGVIAP